MEKLGEVGEFFSGLVEGGGVDGETRRLLVVALVLCVAGLVALGLHVYNERKSRRRN